MIYPAPTYLATLVTIISDQLLSEIQKEYGEDTTAFKFNTAFKSLVQTWNKEYGEYGGTLWGIDKADVNTVIFNQSKNGYEAMMELKQEEDLSSTKTIDFANETEIVIAFQYSGDETDYLEDGTSEFEQDYFGWIVIYQYTDNKLTKIFDRECA